MTAVPWDDPDLPRRLQEVVDDLGRRTAFDPPRLRAALNDSLGSRAHDVRAGVDALVVGVEEEVPQGLLDRIDPAGLAERLTARGLQPPIADWVLSAWADALRLNAAASARRPVDDRHDDAAPAPTELPTELPTEQRAALPIQLPGDRNASRHELAAATSLPRSTTTSGGVAEGTGSAEGRKRGLSDRRTVLIAPLVVVALVSTGVGVFLANRGDSDPTATTDRGTATPPISAPAGSVTPTGNAISASPSPDSALAALKVLAHEGGWERFASETVPALVDAAAHGYAGETDVRWTSDGVPVLIHNPTPSTPMSCAHKYVIADTSFATLKAKCSTKASASKNGKRYPIPAFADAVEQVAAVPGAQLFAEVKTTQSAAQVSAFLKVLQDNDMTQRTVITSFKPGELAKMRSAAQKGGENLRLMQFVRDRALSGADAKRAHLWAVAVRSDALTAGYVRSLHEAGLIVIAWTINDTGGWAAARKAKVDHVLTDRPGAYLSWLAKA